MWLKKKKVESKKPVKAAKWREYVCPKSILGKIGSPWLKTFAAGAVAGVAAEAFSVPFDAALTRSSPVAICKGVFESSCLTGFANGLVFANYGQIIRKRLVKRFPSLSGWWLGIVGATILNVVQNAIMVPVTNLIKYKNEKPENKFCMYQFVKDKGASALCEGYFQSLLSSLPAGIAFLGFAEGASKYLAANPSVAGSLRKNADMFNLAFGFTNGVFAASTAVPVGFAIKKLKGEEVSATDMLKSIPKAAITTGYRAAFKKCVFVRATKYLA